MITSQKKLQETVKGFRFNLGYSGKYFHHSTGEENEGDDALIGRSWFTRFPSIILLTSHVTSSYVMINHMYVLKSSTE